LWLANVTKTVMRGLDDGDGDLKRYRSILRRFVAPAFVSADAPACGSDPLSAATT